MGKVYLAFIEGGHAGLLNGKADPNATPGKETPYIKSLGRKIQEEEFNKPTAAKLRDELKRAGVHVYDPAPDVFDTSLKARTDFANKTYWQYCSKYGKDNVVAIYVSIHFNALDSKFDGVGKDPSGFSVHIYKGQTNKKSGDLARCIIDELKNGTKQINRGIVEQDLHVTRETVFPAALTENGFMDNEVESNLMLNPSFQKEVAIEHAKGICKYFGIPYVTEQKPEPKKEDKKTKVNVTTGWYYEGSNGLKELEKFLKSKGWHYTKEVVK
jgi:N-acetylmuramoyl-L-alanine amidase